jgi:hypothetical protein
MGVLWGCCSVDASDHTNLALLVTWSRWEPLYFPIMEDRLWAETFAEAKRYRCGRMINRDLQSIDCDELDFPSCTIVIQYDCARESPGVVIEV